MIALPALKSAHAVITVVPCDQPRPVEGKRGSVLRVYEEYTYPLPHGHPTYIAADLRPAPVMDARGGLSPPFHTAEVLQHDPVYASLPGAVHDPPGQLLHEVILQPFQFRIQGCKGLSLSGRSRLLPDEVYHVVYPVRIRFEGRKTSPVDGAGSVHDTADSRVVQPQVDGEDRPLLQGGLRELLRSVFYRELQVVLVVFIYKPRVLQRPEGAGLHEVPVVPPRHGDGDPVPGTPCTYLDFYAAPVVAERLHFVQRGEHVRRIGEGRFHLPVMDPVGDEFFPLAVILYAPCLMGHHVADGGVYGAAPHIGRELVEDLIKRRVLRLVVFCGVDEVLYERKPLPAVEDGHFVHMVTDHMDDERNGITEHSQRILEDTLFSPVDPIQFYPHDSHAEAVVITHKSLYISIISVTLPVYHKSFSSTSIGGDYGT